MVISNNCGGTSGGAVNIEELEKLESWSGIKGLSQRNSFVIIIESDSQGGKRYERIR